MICELPLLHVPLKLSGRFDPGASNALAGSTETELRVAELTVNEVVPVALAPAKLKLALMFVVPVLSPFAIPDEPPIDAMVPSPGVHVTLLVMFWEEESLKTPVAVN